MFKSLPIGLLLVVIVVFQYLQHAEIQDLKSDMKPSLTNKEVLTLIEEHEMQKKRLEATAKLAILKQSYTLAKSSTSKNKLMYGSPTARFTLQMYSDIECPYCRQMHSSMKKIVDHSKSLINWEFKHFPLEGHNPSAAKEAQAVECVRENYDNKIAWIALDQFITQTKGNGKGIDNIPNLVRSIGLNGNIINNCLASNSHKDKVNNDYRDGRALGITATPATLLIDQKTKKEYLIKGKKSPEEILQGIAKIMQ